MTTQRILIVAPLTQDQCSVVLEQHARDLYESLRERGHEVELDARGALPPVGYQTIIYLSAFSAGLPRWPVKVLGAPAARRIAWCLDWREYATELTHRHSVLERYTFQEIDEAGCANALLGAEEGCAAQAQAPLSEILGTAGFDELWTSTEREAAELRRITPSSTQVVHVGFCQPKAMLSLGTAPRAQSKDGEDVTIVGPVTRLSGHLEVLAALAGSGLPVTILHPGKTLPPDVDEGLRRFPLGAPIRILSAENLEDELRTLGSSRLVVSLDPTNLPIAALARAAPSGRPLVTIAGGSFDVLSESRFLGVQPTDWRGLLQLALLPLESWSCEAPSLGGRELFFSIVSERVHGSHASGAAGDTTQVSISPDISQLIAWTTDALPPQGHGAIDRECYRTIEQRVRALESGIEATGLSSELVPALIALLKRLAVSTLHGGTLRGLMRSLMVRCAKADLVDSSFLIEAAQLLIQAGDLFGARFVLDQVLRANPRNSLALILVGSIALGVGRPQQAEAVFGVATQVASEQADAWAGLGCAKLQLGNQEGAQQCLYRARSLDPSHSLARQLLSMLPERASSLS